MKDLAHYIQTASGGKARLLAILVSISVFAAGPIILGAKNSGGGSPPVTTTVYDSDTNGAPTLMQSDDYPGGAGQGQASYTSTGNVVSDIYNGTLFLDLYSQTLRTLYITPNDAYNPPQNPPVPIPPPGYYARYGELYVGCYDGSGNSVLLENVTTSSGNCRLGVDFGYSGVKYKLDMGPVQPATGPVTGFVLVTCTQLSSGQCVNWTITPNPNSAPANVANLYYYARGGKLTFLGQYYNTFRIGVTNP